MVENKPSLKIHKNKIKTKYEKRKESFKLFLNKIYLGDLTYSNISNKLINAVKVFIVSTKKFSDDDCLTKASSISYTTIMSLIPTLFVIISILSQYYTGGEEAILTDINRTITQYSTNIDTGPILLAIRGLLNNAGKIGVISGIFMIFTATGMLRSLEKSLNDIWKVKKNRPMFLKIIYYWAILTLGPIMIFAGATVATQITAMFSSPNYNSAAISGKNIWVVGDSASILKGRTGKVELEEISEDQIDFDNQKSYKFDAQTATFKKEDKTMDDNHLKSSHLRDVQFIDNRGWIIGTKGIVLFSNDSGVSWTINQWDKFNFTDIHMINQNKGFITSENGRLLTTTDGGKSWKIVQIIENKNHLLSISFKKNIGLITGSKGLLMKTTNGGASWKSETLDATKKLFSHAYLNKSFIVSDKEFFLIGTEGTILRSDDSGATWKSNSFKEYNYSSIHFFNNKDGVVAGNSGVILHTRDRGVKWNKKTIPTYKVNKLIVDNSSIYAVGDTGLFMISHDRGLNWQGREGRSFITILFNFFAPFAFIWLLFLIAYIALPNTKVPFKHAAIGASFTGAVWVIFILLFIYYVKAFARGTFAIYGALAAIPLFLLMIYSSSVIILYGAEVAYSLMHPDSYKSLKKLFAKKEYLHAYYGIAILHLIYSNFERGKGPTFFKDLLKVAGQKTEEIDYYTNHFIQKGLIGQSSEMGYFPSNTSKNVLLADVIEGIVHITLDIPGGQTKSNFRAYMGKIFHDITQSRKNVVGDLTLYDVIEANK